MTRELACIHAREGVRVNALCPGPLQTELLMKYLNTEEKKQRRYLLFSVNILTLKDWFTFLLDDLERLKRLPRELCSWLLTRYELRRILI